MTSALDRAQTGSAVGAARYLPSTHSALSTDSSEGLGVLCIGYDDSCLKRVSVPLTVGGPAETCDCYVKGDIVSGGFTITSGSRIEVASAPIPGVFTAVPRDPDSTYFAIPLASVVLNTDQYFRVDMGGYDAVFTAISNININSGLLLRLSKIDGSWTAVDSRGQPMDVFSKTYSTGQVTHQTVPSWASSLPRGPAAAGASNSSFVYPTHNSCTPTGNSTNGYAATLVSSKDAVISTDKFYVPLNKITRVTFNVTVASAASGNAIRLTVTLPDNSTLTITLLEGLNVHEIFCVRSGTSTRFFNTHGDATTQAKCRLADPFPHNGTCDGTEVVLGMTTVVPGFYEVTYVEGVAGTRTPVKFTTGASVTIGNVCIDKSGRMGRFYVFVVSDGVAYLTDSVGNVYADDTMNIAGVPVSGSGVVTYNTAGLLYATPNSQVVNLNGAAAANNVGLTATVADTVYEIRILDNSNASYTLKITHSGGTAVRQFMGTGSDTVKRLVFRSPSGNPEDLVLLDENDEVCAMGVLRDLLPGDRVVTPVYIGGDAVSVAATGALTVAVDGTTYVATITGVTGGVTAKLPASDEARFYSVKIKNTSGSTINSITINGIAVTVNLPAGKVMHITVLYDGLNRVVLLPGSLHEASMSTASYLMKVADASSGKVVIGGSDVNFAGTSPVKGMYRLMYENMPVDKPLIIEYNDATVATIDSPPPAGNVSLRYDGKTFTQEEPGTETSQFEELTYLVACAIGDNHATTDIVFDDPADRVCTVIVRQLTDGTTVPLDADGNVISPIQVDYDLTAGTLDPGLARLPAPAALSYVRSTAGMIPQYATTADGWRSLDSVDVVDLNLSSFLGSVDNLPTGTRSRDAYDVAKAYAQTGAKVICCVPALPSQDAEDDMKFYLPTSFGIYCAMRELATTSGMSRVLIYIGGKVSKRLDKQMLETMPCFEISSDACVRSVVSMFCLPRTSDQVLLRSGMLDLPAADVSPTADRSTIKVMLSAEPTSICLNELMSSVGMAGHRTIAPGVVELDHLRKDEYNFMINSYDRTSMSHMWKLYVMGSLAGRTGQFGTAWQSGIQNNITALMDVSSAIDDVFDCRYVKVGDQFIPVSYAKNNSAWQTPSGRTLGFVALVSVGRANAGAILASQNVQGIQNTSVRSWATTNDVSIRSILAIDITTSTVGGYTIQAANTPHVLLDLDRLNLLIAQTAQRAVPVPETATATAAAASGRRRRRD